MQIKQEAIFKKIGVILEELNEQHEYLTQNTQQLGELELDLFLANANFLADHIQIIKKLTVNQLNVAPLAIEQEHKREVVNDHFEEPVNLHQISIEEDEVEEIIPEPEIVEIVEETSISNEIETEVFKLDDAPSTFEFILNDHAQNEKFEFEEKSVDEIFNRPLSKEEELIIAEKKRLNLENIAEEEEIEEEVGPEPFLVIKEESFPIVKEDLHLEPAPNPSVVSSSTDLVEDPSNKPTLNDLLAGKTKATVNTEKPAISDLKQAINLNDKLLYIKDLFNGYNLAFAEAIEIANKLPNFEAADNFFQKNYAIKNNWSEKQNTVDQFYELLNQRFR
jgi:hypothetical protein